jgi:hypothetical protein
MLVQSVAATHCTQTPVPSQTLPPFDVQALPCGLAGKIGIPELHPPVWQSFVEVGTFVSSIWASVPPWPSHTTF